MSKAILVTGATGNIGGLVIPQLIEVGATVRAYVRDKSKASSLSDMGVELHEGDFTTQEALTKAAEGIDALLAITPANPDAVAQGTAIVNAARKAGSPRYVRISAIGAGPDAPTANGRLHGESDRELVDSGLPYTILRPHYYMQNLFFSVETIKDHGSMYWGMGDGKLGMIDVRDVADCAVAALLNEGHEDKIYDPTGPELLTFGDVATIIGEMIGKEVTYVQVSLDDVYNGIIEAGWGEWGADVMKNYSKAYAEGWGEFTNADVQKITGHEPRSFKDFANKVLSFAFKD